MSFYERNSMASKRSYETYMEVATVYQHAIAHLESLAFGSEEWIEEPGSITCNEHRPKRLMTKREPTDEADEMALSSDGAHDLLQADLAGFTMAYDPQGTSHDTRKVEQQEQEPYEDMGVPCMSSWEKNKQNWITLYNRLHKNPSKYSNDPEEKRAGLWMMHMRASYKKGILSQERIDELETIHGWKWGAQREEVYTWDEHLQHWITQYEKRLQTPSSRSKDLEEKRAGMWQSIQRVTYKNGTLSQERIKKLLESPGWEWGPQRAQRAQRAQSDQRDTTYRWEEHLQHWITEYEKRLQTPSSHSKDLDEKRAGLWQSTQWVAYKNGTLSQERIKELVASPGWEWGPQRSERAQRDTTYRWEERLQHWITQYEKLQRTPSTISKDSEERRAGQWQDTQRTVYKHGSLSQERINELDATEGWKWSAK